MGRMRYHFEDLDKIFELTYDKATLDRPKSSINARAVQSFDCYHVKTAENRSIIIHKSMGMPRNCISSTSLKSWINSLQNDI